jgi:HK97 family phage prohead protease
MAVLDSAARDNLPDSAFGYIEPGGKKVNGKTVPGKLRHFPLHDAAHVRNALARAAQGARFGKEAMPSILAAAKKHGIQHDEASSGTGRSFDSLYPEVRFLADVPEIRSIGDGQPQHITGYAAAFGKLSRRLGGFVERVMPTAFEEARNAGYPDVVCRYNHKDDMVLGTTAAGTLSLDIDERGLRYDVVPPNHRGDILELIQRGDVRYSSFAFRCAEPGTDDEWGVTDYNYPMRSLHNVALLDVAPVLDPAYRDTSVVARNMTGAVESLAMWVDAEPAEVRSMLEAGQAMRFFTRTGRPSAPQPESVPEVRDSEMLDDPAVALRTWSFKDEPAGEPEQREHTADEFAEHVEESRAMHNHETMCRKWVGGEPCVLGQGHDGGCQGRCWGSKDGIPCSMAEGHGGDHVPHAYDDGNGPGRGRPKSFRDGEGTEDASGEEKRTLSGPEALAEVFAMRDKLTVID